MKQMEAIAGDKWIAGWAVKVTVGWWEGTGQVREEWNSEVRVSRVESKHYCNVTTCVEMIPLYFQLDRNSTVSSYFYHVCSWTEE
jgi:hypothetical protein